MINGRKYRMEHNIQETQWNQVIFQELMKRAYERGVTEEGITVGKLLEEIMLDLQNLISKK